MSRKTNNMILIKRCSDSTRLPIRATKYSAGLDLFASAEVIIPKKKDKLVETGLKIEMPNTLYGRLADCSGVCLTSKLMVVSGVIDADYRGELKVCFYNFGDSDVVIKPGDRICQMILTPYKSPILFEVVNDDLLSETGRTEGFGSTSKKLKSSLDL